ncbi:xanthine dehydrogenase accessory protein XdhC [Albirhodobacter sp. R86504]|uniref:xanthine dehydrogenase accessory protein XdhC n=1 Tax=Albirhodobacter sp. R86504 TaxID=3093848 RepID=UPI00366C54D7
MTTCIRILIVEGKGSLPRPAGVSMLVYPALIEGTIGGGAMEWEMMREARAMIAARATSGRVMRLALGPQLGQCCGGHVTMLLEPWSGEAPNLRPVLAEAGSEPPAPLKRLAMKLRTGQAANRVPKMEGGWLFEPPMPTRAPVWVWGAGHVGRAVVDVLAPLPDCALTWIDFARDRFPDHIAQDVDLLIASDPASLITHAPRSAHHLILTHSHALDLALCHGLLTHGHASIGLIGAQTKANRFRTRLRELGHSSAQISSIACPIGDVTLGKHPQAIAIGIAGGLVRELNRAKVPPKTKEFAG